MPMRPALHASVSNAVFTGLIPFGAERFEAPDDGAGTRGGGLAHSDAHTGDSARSVAQATSKKSVVCQQ
jgi:hypothetical protein